ncbi:hypothetical protein TIFTF001_016959 [Ficus carica]|uniref:DUF8039 domain-containing protein n=1 Tax=Ficus carica TaxID=3494 RepID=A0AA88ATV7_FICCA|nr:hypothetical protein TIFTF001_016959 [Ficus carica]
MSQDHEEELLTQSQIGKPRRTNSPRFNPDEDGKQRTTLMRKVHLVRTKGERIEVSFDVKGQPLRKEGDELHSWIRVLAREHIPIWISDFRSADLVPNMFLSKLLSGIILMKKLCGNDRQKWFTITPPSARMIGKDSLRIDISRNSKDYPNKEKDFSEQETQRSFKSVGSNDILTKSLGNAEHSGRTRSQSKFVKQSQYFNLVQSSRENAEVSDMKQQLAVLERTVHEFCAKHGINQETIAEETTTPTVDQHNSFKASCTLNEKKAGPLDPQPMPNASKECQLFFTDLVNGGDVLIAIGRAYMECVPTNTVHGIPLGEENVQVTITVPKLKRALLPIPTNKATCIEEAIGGFVAWPKRLVVVQKSLSQASRGPSHAPDREAEGSKRTKNRARKKKIQL